MSFQYSALLYKSGKIGLGVRNVKHKGKTLTKNKMLNGYESYHM